MEHDKDNEMKDLSRNEDSILYLMKQMQERVQVQIDKSLPDDAIKAAALVTAKWYIDSAYRETQTAFMWFKRSRFGGRRVHEPEVDLKDTTHVTTLNFKDEGTRHEGNGSE